MALPINIEDLICRRVRDALSYIQNYIIKEKVAKVLGQAEAERIYNIPYAAVEEALSNAVYHRSYQIGEPITVMVTPEKMEITSLPGPDRTITDEDIRNRRMISRRYRNRRIGDFLKELKLIEGRNTGIPTILRAMEANGSELPDFLTDEERSYLTVVLPVHKKFLQTEQSAMPTVNNSMKKRRSLPEIKVLIVRTLQQKGNLSTSELTQAMGYAKVSASVSKAIKELIEEEKIAYLNPEKSILKTRSYIYVIRDRGRFSWWPSNYRPPFLNQHPAPLPDGLSPNSLKP